MDNKLIAQYGEDILSYRLRTARQKKRAQREAFDKQLIGLYLEEKALRQKRWDLGWEPMIPPIQRGWKRFFVVRPDVARGRHGEFFAAILEKINTCDYFHRKDFLVKKGRKRRKKWTVRPLALGQLHRSEFEKLTENQKQFFHPEVHVVKWSREPVVYYVFNEPWRFVLQVKPNLVGKRWIIDPALEARLGEIKDVIRWNNYAGRRQQKLIYGHALYWDDELDDRDQHPYRHWPVRKIVDETKGEVYNE